MAGAAGRDLRHCPYEARNWPPTVADRQEVLIRAKALTWARSAVTNAASDVDRSPTGTVAIVIAPTWKGRRRAGTEVLVTIPTSGASEVYRFNGDLNVVTPVAIDKAHPLIAFASGAGRSLGDLGG